MVANRAGLKLLWRKEIRCIARRRAALWPEIDFACLEGELEFRPEGRFAHAATDIRKCQLRRVIQSQRSGISSVVRIGHNIPDGLAALHYSVIKGQGDGALILVDLARFQILIFTDQLAFDSRRLGSEIGDWHVSAD
jgi:hypothetical protein